MDFVKRLREAFSEYRRQKRGDNYDPNYDPKVAELEHKVAKDVDNIKHVYPLTSDVALYGGAGAAAGSIEPLVAGSAIGPAGLALGAAGMGAAAYMRKNAIDNAIRQKKQHSDELQKAYTEQWTKYKNKRIAEITGKRVGDLAKEGKMVTDAGDIIDIDYDYYRTVPFTTLERVFETGADAVWDKAHAKKK